MWFLCGNILLLSQSDWFDYYVGRQDAVPLSIDDNNKLFTDMWNEFIYVNILQEKINKHEINWDMILVELYFCKNPACHLTKYFLDFILYLEMHFYFKHVTYDQGNL